MNPILFNHDHSKVIGKWSTDGRYIVAEMQPGHELTREEIFSIFGNCGVRILEQVKCGEQMLVRKFQIIEFSLCHGPAATAPVLAGSSKGDSAAVAEGSPFSAKILRAFQPGDVVIVECDCTLSDEAAAHLASLFETAGLRAIVLGKGMHVIGREEAPHHIDQSTLGSST